MNVLQNLDLFNITQEICTLWQDEPSTEECQDTLQRIAFGIFALAGTAAALYLFSSPPAKRLTYSELVKAIQNKDLNLVKGHVKSGASVNETFQPTLSSLDHMEQVPLTKTPLLTLAVNSNAMEIVRYLLNQGAEVDILDDDGLTPLYHAADAGQCDMIRLLCEHGANKEFSINGRPYTVLGSAIYSRHSEAVRTLIDARTSLYSPSEAGEAIHIAAVSGNVEALELFLEKDPDSLESENPNGISPLELAIRNKREEAIIFLLENGADLSKVDEKHAVKLGSLIGEGKANEYQQFRQIDQKT